MSLSDLAAIGSFISGIAVLVSLIYLSLQVRQNTHAHKATAHQNRQNFVTEHSYRITDAAMASIYLRGMAGDTQMTEVEFTQYRFVMHNWFFGMSEVVWQHERGVLDGDTFAGSMAALRSNLSNPGARAVWEVSKPLMPASFQNLVEKTIAETEIGRAPSAFKVWQASLAN